MQIGMGFARNMFTPRLASFESLFAARQGIGHDAKPTKADLVKLDIDHVSIDCKGRVWIEDLSSSVILVNDEGLQDLVRIF